MEEWIKSLIKNGHFYAGLIPKIWQPANLGKVDFLNYATRKSSAKATYTINKQMVRGRIKLIWIMGRFHFG